MKMAAILDLKVKMRSNDTTNIRYEFLDPQNPIKHVSISSIDQTVQKLIFKMADGSHIGFKGQNEVKQLN